MAFDFAWDFRLTAGYVSDPTYAVFEDGTTVYPHTYTNTDGKSINAGYTVLPNQGADRSATNDPRIAGHVYANGATDGTFRIDLDSGSAPGAGDYALDIASGSQAGGDGKFQIKDNTTVLITATRVSLAANHFLDATLTDVTATTTWTGTPVVKTFASTIVYVISNYDDSGAHFSLLAHFRLTLQVAGGATKFIQEHLGRGIGRGIFQGR